MNISKSKTILLGLFAAGLTTWQPAKAGFSQGDSVTLGGQPVFQMSGADGMTGQHRAWLAQDALDNALVAASDRSPTAVRVNKENGAITVTLDGKRFATADACSATSANLTPDALADKWAQSVSDFLSDQDRTASYLATLKNEHGIKADVAVLERTLYTPAGFTFPIVLTNAISSNSCKAGDVVEGTTDKDIVLGGYAIPAGTTLIGEVCLVKTDDPNNFTIRFNSLRTPNGTTTAIDGMCLSSTLVSSKGPHKVSTYAIPSGMANGIPEIAGRIPAGIGIGALDNDAPNMLVFDKTTGVLTAGRPMFVQFEEVSQVAVIMRPNM